MIVSRKAKKNQQPLIELFTRGKDRVRPHSLVAFVEWPAKTTEYKLGIHVRLTCLRKQSKS